MVENHRNSAIFKIILVLSSLSLAAVRVEGASLKVDADSVKPKPSPAEERLDHREQSFHLPSVRPGGVESRTVRISQDLRPIDWKRFKKGRPDDALAIRFEEVLRRGAKQALTSWYNEENDFGAQTSRYLSLGSHGFRNLKDISSTARALAIVLKLGVYDPEEMGISREAATEMTIKLAASIAKTHKENGSKWGYGWESINIAANAAEAAWLLWEQVSEPDRKLIAKMLVGEVSRIRNPQYYRDMNGVIQQKGNSSADSVAWDARGAFLAASMMPEHPKFNEWMNLGILFSLSANARPFDTFTGGDNTINKEIVNGRMVFQWLSTQGKFGSNLNPDGTVTNHGLNPHMNYTASDPYVAYFGLAGLDVPRGALYNYQYRYEALSEGEYMAPPFLSPGGSHYVIGENVTYDPVASDRSKESGFLSFDIIADIFALDSLVSLKGRYWAEIHSASLLEELNNRPEKARKQMVEHSKVYLIKWLDHQKAFAVSNKVYGPLIPAFSPPAPLEDPLIRLYEAEKLQASSQRKEAIISDSSSSGGRYHQLETLGVGDFVDYTLPVKATARYEIILRVVKGIDRARFKLSIDGRDLGEGYEIDGYMNGAEIVSVHVGKNIVLEAGSHTIRLTVLGKNDRSEGFKLGLDAIYAERLSEK